MLQDFSVRETLPLFPVLLSFTSIMMSLFAHALEFLLDLVDLWVALGSLGLFLCGILFFATLSQYTSRWNSKFTAAIWFFLFCFIFITTACRLFVWRNEVWFILIFIFVIAVLSICVTIIVTYIICLISVF